MKSEHASAEQSTSKSNGASKATAKGNGASRKVHNENTFEPASNYSDYSREQLIAERAYFHAERRGFEPNNDLGDWLQAETEINDWLLGSH